MTHSVFTSLIVPALAAKRFAERYRLAIGYVGADRLCDAWSGGLVGVRPFDPGAVIVVTLLVTFIAAVIASLAVPAGLARRDRVEVQGTTARDAQALTSAARPVTKLPHAISIASNLTVHAFNVAMFVMS